MSKRYKREILFYSSGNDFAKLPMKNVSIKKTREQNAKTGNDQINHMIFIHAYAQLHALLCTAYYMKHLDSI